MRLTIPGRSLDELADENTTLYATPDDEPSWDGSNHVLAWTISTQEPDGLHVRVDISSEEDSWNARSLILDAIQRSELARCPVCGEVDHWDHLYWVDANPIVYALHDSCTPLYVDEPDALEYLADHYHEVPGVWGWDYDGAFVGIRDVDMIRDFLDAHGITYTTE